MICVGLKVPTVLLPPPSMIGARIAGSLPTLGADFMQTVIRAVIPGWIMGSLAGFLIALLCDRFGFLRRGLMPIGNFISALPIIGIAPILVMWFGFDWQSKAAVVVVMTFFPMLVNTVAGLASAGHLERDLMRSYGASWSRTLWPCGCRLPCLHLQRAEDQRHIGHDRRESWPSFSARRSSAWVSGFPRKWGGWRSTWSGRRSRLRPSRVRPFMPCGSRRAEGDLLAPLQPAEIERTVYTSRASPDAGQQGRA